MRRTRAAGLAVIAVAAVALAVPWPPVPRHATTTRPISARIAPARRS